MTKETKELENIVQQQSELIKQLRTAIGRLEQKMMAMDRKTTRVTEVARRATINITNITRTIKGMRSD